MKRFSGQTHLYRGKVRDVYTIRDRWLVMIASDRISAFDVILPRTIPYKGQVLNQIAAYMLNRTRDICPNWLMETPAPQAAIGKKCTPFKIELVIRGNLTGHAWRVYSSGARVLCGQSMPDGMKENDLFSTPLITPSTKAAEGHDEDISRDEILSRGLASAQEWEQMEQYTHRLFERGRQLAAERGLMLVDTKYEFGKIGNEIYLMDEIHTPDSSRYFYTEGFEARQAAGERQLQLSKEFVREWLIAHNFMGREGQHVPPMSDEWLTTISNRYVELYEKLIGEPFRPEPLSEEETTARVNAALSRLV